ncbi:MAG: type II toxin-antitoxin system PemK/MazF family toxin [Candidatus Micrarchaeota archaeon]
MRRRDVIIARVFFSDSPESKVRPAIVLSDDEYNSSDYLLVSAITTASDEYCLMISGNDANCQLEGGSGARFDGIVKLHKKQVVRGIGRVSLEFHSKLVEKIISVLK